MAEEVLKPTEWEKLLTWVQQLLGHEIPWYIKFPLGVLVFLTLSASVLLMLLVAISKIKEIWAEKLIPYTYKPEQRQRAANRRTFARYLSREIVNRNIAERWRDEEFADLEAEVEAEGDRRSLFPFVRKGGLRRERSLTRALEKSTERLILLEGDPGSGKSVALRHVAYRMSEGGAKSRRLEAKLPIFVNLKEIKRAPDEPIDRVLVRKLVFETLTRINDHFVDDFLDENFDVGIKKGSFVFFFDSFDEIPEILSSTQSDDVIEKYSSAISDFLSGMNECRSIVASRSYKGPARQGWRTFRILELSSSRQQTLVRRALALKLDLVPKLLGELSLAQEDVRMMARNPMLLGLLCEHVRLGHNFPSTAYEVFSKYIEHRFDRDADRVRSRHGLSTDELRVWAERTALAMTSDRALGLSPRRKDLRAALRRQYPRISLTGLDSGLDALEFIKFGRSDGSTDTGNARQFTFSHRRFQEYFTTRVVIADPDRVNPIQLLTDARWRETAVVLLQTGTPDDSNRLLTAASGILNQALYSLNQSPAQLNTGNPDTVELASAQRLMWAPGTLHLMGILQAGLANRPDSVPDHVKETAGKIVNSAFERGDLLDQKFALEVAGIVPQISLVDFLRTTLARDSQWLNDIAYYQIAKLVDIPEDIRRWIRAALLRWALNGQLRRNWHGVQAHLLRLQGHRELLQAAQFARWIRIFDFMLIIVLFTIVTPLISRVPNGNHSISIVYFSVILISTIIFCQMYWKVYLVSWGWALYIRGSLLATIIAGVITSLFSPQLNGKFSLFPTIGLASSCSIVWLYMGFWAAAAARCVNQGKFTSLVARPLAPFVFFEDCYRGSKIFLKMCSDQPGRVAIAGLSALIGGLALCAFFIYGQQWMESTRWIGAPFALVVTVTGAGWFFYHAFRIAKDYLTFRSFNRRYCPHLDGITLTQAYHTMATGIGQLKLLRRVRVGTILQVNLDGEQAIRQLLSGLANENDGFLARVAEQRDELYMMLERVARERSVHPSGDDTPSRL